MAKLLRYYEFSKQHPEYFVLIFLERTLPPVRDTSRFMFLKDLKEQNRRPPIFSSGSI